MIIYMAVFYIKFFKSYVLQMAGIAGPPLKNIGQSMDSCIYYKSMQWTASSSKLHGYCSMVRRGIHVLFYIDST